MTSWQDYKHGREDVGNPTSSLLFLRLYPAAVSVVMGWQHRIRVAYPAVTLFFFTLTFCQWNKLTQNEGSRFAAN